MYVHCEEGNFKRHLKTQINQSRDIHSIKILYVQHCRFLWILLSTSIWIQFPENSSSVLFWQAGWQQTSYSKAGKSALPCVCAALPLVAV